MITESLTLTSTPTRLDNDAPCVGGLVLQSRPDNTETIYIGGCATNPGDSACEFALRPGERFNPKECMATVPGNLSEIAARAATSSAVLVWVREPN